MIKANKEYTVNGVKLSGVDLLESELDNITGDVESWNLTALDDTQAIQKYTANHDWKAVCGACDDYRFDLKEIKKDKSKAGKIRKEIRKADEIKWNI